nr:MAG TPA: hypothetical protein [Caudoviricetes sp.]
MRSNSTGQFSASFAWSRSLQLLFVHPPGFHNGGFIFFDISFSFMFTPKCYNKSQKKGRDRFVF